jgi:hypothetical protein
MYNKYAINVIRNYALCVFLNEGVEIDQGENNPFLLVEINGPREITTKVVSEDELKSAKYKDYLPVSVTING